MSDEHRLELRLDNALVVQWAYASEERLTKRNEAYRKLIDGVDAEQVTFEAVCEQRRDAFGTVIFPDTETMRHFVAVTITHAHLANRVPVLTEPFRARSRHAVFVAEKAA